MGIRCDEYNQVCVVAVDGDLDGEAARALLAAADTQAQRRMTDFVIDLEKCGFIDSEGLEALLALSRRCEELAGQLRLAALDENCRKILEITRLEPRFQCDQDVAAAMRTMR